MVLNFDSSAMTEWPELVIGLVGPVGVNMDLVQRKLGDVLKAVGYVPHDIHITKLMSAVEIEGQTLEETSDRVLHYKSRIKYANEVRKKCENDAALAALAIDRIRDIRREHWAAREYEGDKAQLPIERAAYVVRQLKREEEVKLLRRVYGRKFIQISVQSSQKERTKSLERSIAQSSPDLTPQQCIEAAKELVALDMFERTDPHGQRIDEVFHLGDAFIHGKNEETIRETVERFIHAFFGKNSISPTRDEYGSYIAASASLRSLDLARQVGAAIFSPRGEVISLGCNEVPKFGGGTYWTGDGDAHRDFDDGIDPNRTEKNRIIYDFLSTLEQAELFKEGLTADRLFADSTVRKKIKDAAVSDITEFGRMAHAEMTALCDAARLGRPTSGATVFVTTFPCHNCAKHLVAAGVKRVVFIEPYPKSKALDLHEDSTVLDEKHESKVVFEHFVGISPRRYRDIFEKTSRRGKDGKLADWYYTEPMPLLEDKGASYVWYEESAVLSTLVKLALEMGVEIPDMGSDRIEEDASEVQ
jgi:deoxycytidylate deaminase